MNITFESLRGASKGHGPSSDYENGGLGTGLDGLTGKPLSACGFCQIYPTGRSYGTVYVP